MIGIGAPAEYNSYAIKKRLGKIWRYVDFTNKRILDVGCGNGAYTMEMAKVAKFVTGIDIEPLRLTIFRKQKEKYRIRNLVIVEMSAEELRFKDETFDIITLIEVLEHVPNEKKCLEECKRVLKWGGQLILFVPNKLYPFETHGAKLGKVKISNRIPFISWLPSQIHSRIANARVYMSWQIERLLERAGFRIGVVDWIYPPLDKIRLPLSVKNFYRKNLAKILELTPLRIFGVSILVIAQKR